MNKDSGLPCEVALPHNGSTLVGGGGAGQERSNTAGQNFKRTTSFVAPLLEIEHCLSLLATLGFAGLFIGRHYWCRLS
jgi:hypothetical protein